MAFQIRGTVTGQSLRIQQDYIVADTSDYLSAEFTFSPEWDGLTKVAVFSAGDVAYQFLLENDRIVRTQHLNLTTGTWECSLVGVAPDGMKITSDPCDIKVKRTGSANGEPPPVVTPSLGEQILAQLGYALETLQKI